MSAGIEYRRRSCGPLKTRHGGRTPQRRPGRDRGQTFVEILVSIVLLGTVVSGTLTALRATIVSSRADADQAKANTWLLAAEDALYKATYYSCADPGPGPDPDPGIDANEIKTAYEDAINLAPRPAGWETATIDIAALQFWKKSDGTEVWDPICPTDPQNRWSAQLVDIYVLGPGGTVGKTVQVIKRGG